MGAVEAHISGKRDAVHVGRVGGNYREQIAQTSKGGSDDLLDEVGEAEDEGLSAGWSLVAGSVALGVVVLSQAGDLPSSESGSGGQGDETDEPATWEEVTA